MGSKSAVRFTVLMSRTNAQGGGFQVGGINQSVVDIAAAEAEFFQALKDAREAAVEELKSYIHEQGPQWKKYLPNNFYVIGQYGLHSNPCRALPAFSNTTEGEDGEVYEGPILGWLQGPQGFRPSRGITMPLGATARLHAPAIDLDVLKEVTCTCKGARYPEDPGAKKIKRQHRFGGVVARDWKQPEGWTLIDPWTDSPALESPAAKEAAGRYTVDCKFSNPSVCGVKDQDITAQLAVNVFRPDLVPIGDKWNGDVATAMVNFDDDDQNGVLDKDQSGDVPGENDLVGVKLKSIHGVPRSGTFRIIWDPVFLRPFRAMTKGSRFPEAVESVSPEKVMARMDFMPEDMGDGVDIWFEAVSHTKKDETTKVKAIFVDKDGFTHTGDEVDIAVLKPRLNLTVYYLEGDAVPEDMEEGGDGKGTFVYPSGKVKVRIEPYPEIPEGKKVVLDWSGETSSFKPGVELPKEFRGRELLAGFETFVEGLDFGCAKFTVKRVEDDSTVGGQGDDVLRGADGDDEPEDGDDEDAADVKVPRIRVTGSEHAVPINGSKSFGIQLHWEENVPPEERKPEIYGPLAFRPEPRELIASATSDREWKNATVVPQSEVVGRGKIVPEYPKDSNGKVKVVGDIEIVVFGIESFQGISDSPSGQATARSVAHFDQETYGNYTIWRHDPRKDRMCDWYLFFHLNPGADGHFEVTSKPPGYEGELKYCYVDNGNVCRNFSSSGKADVTFAIPGNKNIYAFVNKDTHDWADPGEQMLWIKKCKVKASIIRLVVRDFGFGRGLYNQPPAYCPVPGRVEVNFDVEESIPVPCLARATLHKSGSTVQTLDDPQPGGITGGVLRDLNVSLPGKYEVGLRFIISQGGSNFMFSTERWDLYALSLDLEIVGVSESQEEQPGGYIGVNEDDDDGGGTRDLDEPAGHGADDDDLAELKVKANVGGATLPDKDARIEWYAVGQDQVRMFRAKSKAGGPMTRDSNSVPLEGQGVSLWLEARQPSSSAREVSVIASYRPVAGGYRFQDTVNFTIVHVLIAVGGTSNEEDDVVAVGAFRRVDLYFTPIQMLLPSEHGPVAASLSHRAKPGSPAELMPMFFDENYGPTDSVVFSIFGTSARFYAMGKTPSGALNDLDIRASWIAVPPYIPPKKIDVGVENLTVFRMRIENPTDSNADGNINDPATAGNNLTGNEFTYSAGAIGTLTLPARIRLDPDVVEMRNRFRNRVYLHADSIADSHAGQRNVSLAWSSPLAGLPTSGVAVYGGDLAFPNLWASTATFTRLPPSNGDFGRKTLTARVFCGPGGMDPAEDNAPYEVFFPRDAANHPGGQVGSPNWFHYWSLACNIENTIYGGISFVTLGEAPGMTRWSYAGAQNKSSIILYSGVRDIVAPHPVQPWTWSGIDSFWNVYLHEREHVNQIARADNIVGIHPNTCWRYGWSWNVISHNHWDKGPDGKPGIRRIDDDGNGAVDDLILGSPGELGFGDDRRLSMIPTAVDPGIGDWPLSWPLPSKPWCPPWRPQYPEERQAYDAMVGAEDEFAELDWGSPGKKHLSPRWND